MKAPPIEMDEQFRNTNIIFENISQLSSIHYNLSQPLLNMMFQFPSLTMIALMTVFLSAGQVNAAAMAALIAPNAVDACNGKNDYGVGHSCKFQQYEGFCENNACGNLVCVPR
ncbi:hypothetical protein EDD18DRAFT_635322 [Armillaria luteobubalina]|uniref:Uncharacterized protein n=1 Tax=Armillaria luteobubalina TaxID=153913 RepID=A0AA39QKJ1_9AGAR|nr:hypothetical protein EDD18DRAFT_635322 [Armillaria luteobubalina]